MTFTYPEGWPIPQADRGRSAKLARKASKLARDALLTERGPNAISYMTRGYARKTAEFWRRAANSSDDEAEAAGLRESAARSDALGALAGRLWPVSDPFTALERIDLYERQRVVDVNNPDAMIDLRAYFGRARVTCGAAALALGDQVEQYAGSLLHMPVAFLDMEFAVGLQSDWVFQMNVWQNLLTDRPLAYAEFMQRQQGSDCSRRFRGCRCPHDRLHPPTAPRRAIALATERFRGSASGGRVLCGCPLPALTTASATICARALRGRRLSCP